MQTNLLLVLSDFSFTLHERRRSAPKAIKTFFPASPGFKTAQGEKARRALQIFGRSMSAQTNLPARQIKRTLNLVQTSLLRAPPMGISQPLQQKTGLRS